MQNKHQLKPRTLPREKHHKPNTVRIGQKKHVFDDGYFTLVAMSWWKLGFIIAGAYIFINFIFAVLYVGLGISVENADETSILQMFFYSVQTFATIGYGKMVPTSVVANVMMTIQALVSFGFYAVGLGLMFSKFSIPKSHVIFSHNAVITPYNGVPTLMLRIANERHNRIVDARVEMTLLKRVVSNEGYMMRRFFDMHLSRDKAPFLQLSWTVMHPITPNSPLFGMSEAECHASDIEIIVSLTGVDEHTSQPMHARFSYVGDDIIYNAQFVDVVRRMEDLRLEINYTKFHEIVRN